MTEENPKLRASKSQEAWQRGLGMRSLGTDRGPVTDVRIVDQLVSLGSVDFPPRGNWFFYRQTSPPFAGTHSYVSIFNRWGFRLVWVGSFDTLAPVQIATFAGGGVANVVNVDPFATGNTDSLYGVDGDGHAFTQGPDFGFSLAEDPFGIQTFTAGQHGPVVIEGGTTNQLVPWTLPPPGLTVFPQPGGQAGIMFMAQLPNTQLQIHFILEMPLRWPIRST